jgi:hypothetical protein
MLCEQKAETSEVLVKHLEVVHDNPDTTGTKNKSEENKFNCALCVHSEDTEQKLVKHLEVKHKLVDMSNKRKTNQTNPNQRKLNQTGQTCQNGPCCRYLRENRCRYFHEEAAQPEEGWEEVRHHHPRQNNNHPNNQSNYHPNNLHNHPNNNHSRNHYNNQADGVAWCRQELSCTRGRKYEYKHPVGRSGFVIQRRISAQSLGDFFP